MHDKYTVNKHISHPRYDPPIKARRVYSGTKCRACSARSNTTQQYIAKFFVVVVCCCVCQQSIVALLMLATDAKCNIDCKTRNICVVMIGQRQQGQLV
jgi:hypothetical protein